MNELYTDEDLKACVDALAEASPWYEEVRVSVARMLLMTITPRLKERWEREQEASKAQLGMEYLDRFQAEVTNPYNELVEERNKLARKCLSLLKIIGDDIVREGGGKYPAWIEKDIDALARFQKG